jgi:hypothetical protein
MLPPTSFCKTKQMNPSNTERKVLAHGPVRRKHAPKEEKWEQEEEEEEKEKEHPSSPSPPPQAAARLTLGFVLWMAVAFWVCVLATNMATFYHRERIASWFVANNDAPTWPLVRGIIAPRVVQPVAYNTTTPAILYEARLNLAKHLLTGARPCLCMHHMHVPPNITVVRACAVLNGDQMYFMRNLRLIGYNKGAPAHDVLEDDQKIRKRATQLYVEWDDEAGIMHYAQFRDGVAFCLQRVMEEFTA